MAEISVLMSLYKKERPEYVQACFESLLRQTVPADEWVIVEDGPLTKEMYDLLDDYHARYPYLIKRVKLDENQGLGLALRSGIPECRYELIARMDTDDIAREDRFEIQIREFDNNPDLDICGSHIVEFEGSKNNVISKRRVPIKHNEIVKYQKTRSAFNHMTVMYKKTAVLRAGNYEHCPLMEDDLLWVKMILSGACCSNVDDYLVYARTGRAMIERRGGWEYFRKYRDGRRKIYNTSFITGKDYIKTVFVQSIVALLPAKIRVIVFAKLLRSNKKK